MIIKSDKQLPKYRPYQQTPSDLSPYHQIYEWVNNNSPLRSYLIQKRSVGDGFSKSTTTLHKVLQALKDIISSEVLYDTTNPSIILCDFALENALNVRALHLTEIRNQVLLQLTLQLKLQNILRAQPNILGVPVDHQENIPVDHQQNIPVDHQQNIPVDHQQNIQVQPNIQNILIQVQPNIQNILIQLQNKSNQIINQLNLNPKKYNIKPDFYKVLQKLPNLSTPPYTYNDLCKYLSQYILNNKKRFFDDRNIKVALVFNDELGKAFGVQAFHRTQVTNLLRKQLVNVGTQ